MKFLKIRLNKKNTCSEQITQLRSKSQQIPTVCLSVQTTSITDFRRLNCAILAPLALTVVTASELQNNKSQEDHNFPQIFYFDISHLCPFSKF